MSRALQPYDDTTVYAYYDHAPTTAAQQQAYRPDMQCNTSNPHDLQAIANRLGRDEEIEITYKVSRRSTQQHTHASVQHYEQPCTTDRLQYEMEYATSDIDWRVVVVFVVVGFLIGAAFAIMKQIAEIAAMLSAAGPLAIITAAGLTISAAWLIKEISAAIRRK